MFSIPETQLSVSSVLPIRAPIKQFGEKRNKDIKLVTSLQAKFILNLDKYAKDWKWSNQRILEIIIKIKETFDSLTSLIQHANSYFQAQKIEIDPENGKCLIWKPEQTYIPETAIQCLETSDALNMLKQAAGIVIKTKKDFYKFYSPSSVYRKCNFSAIYSCYQCTI